LKIPCVPVVTEHCCPYIGTRGGTKISSTRTTLAIRRYGMPVCPRMVLAAVFTFASVAAFAHPHVFIANKMEVVFDGGTLKGITFTWNFDKMFSSMMLTDLPAQADGSFTPKTAAALKAGGFDNLKNYHYFLAFQVGSRALTKIKIEQFTPRVIDGVTLVYSFFVPLDIPVTASQQTIRVTVYDDSYFVAFDLMHVEDVTITGSDGVTCAVSVEKTTVKPAWPGQYMPDQLVLRMKQAS
jgi:ABC-type uncharacterized transport system substrate-binding protein